MLGTRERILRFRSTDAEQVEATWGRCAPSAKLLRVDESNCRLDWSSASIGGVDLVQYRLQADVRSSIEPEEQIFACRVTTSDGALQSSEGIVSPGVPWISDGSAVEARWAESAVVHAVIFERERAEELARQLCGDDALVLRTKGPEPVSSVAAQHWDREFRHLVSSLVALEGWCDEGDLIYAGLERTALWSILSSFSTTFADAIERSVQTRAAPRTVRRALAYIDANAHLPITIDDVARAVHISTRGLQHAFRRSLDFTPRDYLRRARLAGARQELMDAREPQDLGRIARRWGYSETARFVRYYLAEYGEHPVATLRRAEG